MMGFSLVYWLEEHHSMSSFFKVNKYQRLDEDEYVTFKIPFYLPYQSNWEAARPVEGQIKQGDKYYELVEQKVENDTLYTVCKTDNNARFRFMELAEHINQHVKDSSNETPKKRPSLFKNILKEYTSLRTKHILFVVEWLPIRLVPSSYSENIVALAYDTHAPPPRFV
ncbi:hypothetical protein [Arcicella rigui]|uniref:Uncharacterized protein n=1 Tax=Arcicella rigui TaxID=797020 RepID=A0ABU5QG34_9BACT|nr:hypothetical protein [Arcicella rigui]MEA5141786.1 hypothetical protein [Arcicella rigui]